MFSTSLRDPSRSFDLPPDFWPALNIGNYWTVITSPTSISFFFLNGLKIALIVTVAQ